MKNQVYVYFFLFIMSIFHLSIPCIVFGLSEDVQSVLNEYGETLQDPDIQKFFPSVLRSFKNSEIQGILDPIIINRIVKNPTYIRSFDPNVDDSIVTLLAVNTEFKTLFRDGKFHAVLQNPNQIEELAKSIEEKVIPTGLIIVSGDNQFGDPKKRLQHPFVVEVRDQNDNIFTEDVDVTFSFVFGVGGELSSRQTNIKDTGKAETYFTLGSDPGVYKVQASVADYPSLTQTFTAAAIGGDGEPPPEPTALEIVSGNNQPGEAGKPLAQPFVVKVEGENEPLGGVDVTFRVTSGEGTLWGETSQTISTNEEGKAGITLTLGPGKGVNRVTARIVGTTIPTRTFIAAATIAPLTPSLPVVYWIEGGAILKFNGGNREILVEPSMGWTATSLAVDTAKNKLYWTEKWTGNKRGTRNGIIWSANLNGEETSELRSIDAVPEGIVVDARNGRLYWTNDRGKIQSINVNGKNFNGNFIASLGSPHHIALDLDGNTAWGDIYWTVANEDGSWSIWSAPLDGNVKKVIMSDLGKLGGIAVDGDKLYWTEEVEENHGKISSAYKNGSGNKTLFSLPGSVPLGLAVDEARHRLYWTDNGGNIQSLNLDKPIETEIVVEGLDAPAVAIALGRSSEAVPAGPAAPSTIVERSVESALLANYPNPFNPETWIPYQLSEPADVSVSIYSVNGHLVRRLDLGHRVAGVYRSRSRAAYWDGRNAFGERVASGLYFYTFTAGDFTATRKMLIRK